MTAITVESEILRSTRHHEARSWRELETWLRWLDLGGFSSRDAYERTCADLLNRYPDLDYREFRDEHILELLLAYPEKSRRIRKAHLSSWFKWGVRTDRIGRNPVDRLPTIKRNPQPVIQVFTETEQAALEALPSPDGPLMTLMFETGMRLSEAVNLRCKRLDFDEGMVIIKEGAKGGRDRQVPMVPKLRQAMAEMVLTEGLNPDDYLWYDKPGGAFAVRVRRAKPIARTSFGRWWYRCLDDAGVAYLKRDPKAGVEGYGNPHQARHTFATRWRARGLDIDELSKLLGHASEAITADVYVHTGTGQIRSRMLDLLGVEG